MSCEPDEAAFSAMQWNTPLSEWHAARLLERLAPGAAGAAAAAGSAGSVLDLGCGWGELLIRAVLAGGAGCTGIGVDTDETQFARARARTAELGVADRVRFVAGRAQAWSEPADRVICVGSSHAWGGTTAALTALRSVVSPGGRLLFGDGFWEADPGPEAVAIFGEEVPRLSELLEHAVAGGWRVLSQDTADQHEWDEFESNWRAGREEWLLEHPDAPDADERRRHLDERLREYVSVYRGVLGFCYLVLTH
jgi:SAM-dependent methyltransferase